MKIRNLFTPRNAYEREPLLINGQSSSKKFASNLNEKKLVERTLLGKTSPDNFLGRKEFFEGTLQIAHFSNSAEKAYNRNPTAHMTIYKIPHGFEVTIASKIPLPTSQEKNENLAYRALEMSNELAGRKSNKKERKAFDGLIPLINLKRLQCLPQKSPSKASVSMTYLNDGSFFVLPSNQSSHNSPPSDEINPGEKGASLLGANPEIVVENEKTLSQHNNSPRFMIICTKELSDFLNTKHKEMPLPATSILSGSFFPNPSIPSPEVEKTAKSIIDNLVCAVQNVEKDYSVLCQQRQRKPDSLTSLEAEDPFLKKIQSIFVDTVIVVASY